MSSLRYWVWLSSVSFANPRARYALVEHYGDAENAFFAPPGEFKKLPGVSEKEAELFEKRDLLEVERILEACRREHIQILTLADAGYPQRLRNIFAPPVVLYIKGRLPDVDNIPAVAVIGTRKATPYGIKMGRDIAFEIAKCGCCVGVLGTCHAEGGELREDVQNTGALVSEYPPGTKPQNRFFRDRNRISAGLAHAVCVVEAPEKSGCLLFTQEALEQGKEIFAVPCNADAANSGGIMILLKQGARPAARGWDVMEDFAALYPAVIHRPGPDQRPPAGPKTAENPEPGWKIAPAQKTKEEDKPAPSPKKEIDKENSAGYIDLHEQLKGLNADQLQIVTAIGRGETHIDDIIEATGMSAARVLAQLTILEIKGYVRRVAGRRVSLNTIQK